MEFNFSNSPRDREEYNERQNESTKSFGWSPKSPLGIGVLAVGIAVVGGFLYFNSNANKPVTVSGLTETLKVERVDQSKINFDKKFRDRTAQPSFGAFIYTSDVSGPCEPAITKAVYDRGGDYITLTRSSVTGCILNNKTFQQKITREDGSPFPSTTRVVWEKPVG